MTAVFHVKIVVHLQTHHLVNVLPLRVEPGPYTIQRKLQDDRQFETEHADKNRPSKLSIFTKMIIKASNDQSSLVVYCL